VSAELGHIRFADLQLYVLQLNVVEVGLHLEVEGMLLVYYELPDRGLLPLVSLGHEEELGEKVLLSLGCHYNRGQA
jgi:hypothetical protein